MNKILPATILQVSFPWLVPTRTSNHKDGGRVTTPLDVHPLQVYWSMPRRIRLKFEEANGRICGLTGERDSTVVRTYRTRNYGTDYSEGFAHPLTPYYRQSAKQVTRLPVHPRPGGISYRHWRGVVFPSDDGLRYPAQAVSHWPNRDREVLTRKRVFAFGYDMDKMKARAWVESEMPLWLLQDSEVRSLLEKFVDCATEGASTVARLLTSSVKAARHERPADASGDYGFIAEHFFRDTEAAFYELLDKVVVSIESDPDVDDPTITLREAWLKIISRTGIRMFDTYAPSEGLEHRAMHRQVRARFFFTLALGGRGKVGLSLYKRLDIPFSATKLKGGQVA